MRNSNYRVDQKKLEVEFRPQPNVSENDSHHTKQDVLGLTQKSSSNLPITSFKLKLKNMRVAI